MTPRPFFASAPLLLVALMACGSPTAPAATAFPATALPATVTAVTATPAPPPSSSSAPAALPPAAVPVPAPAPQPAPPAPQPLVREPAAPPPAPAAPQNGSTGLVVSPGAFCSPAGALGVTSSGTAMSCKLDSAGKRLRWSKA